MNKRTLSERDICTKFITPALENSGWDKQLQIPWQLKLERGNLILQNILKIIYQQYGLRMVLHYKGIITLFLGNL